MRSIWRDDIPQTTNPLRFFLFTSKPHWRVAVLATFFVVLASIARAFIPYIYKVIVDTATTLTTTGTYDTLWSAVIAFLIISLASNLLWRGSGFSGMHWATGVRATGRAALTSYLTRHSHQYFSDRFAGSLSNKIKQAGDSLRDFTEAWLWQFLAFFISVTASFIIVFATSPIVGFILLGLFAFITPLNIYLARKRVPLSVEAQASETKLNGASVDLITNITAVHEYARTPFELLRIKELINIRREFGMRNWRFSEWVLVSNNFIQALFTGGMLLVSVYLATQGIITAGDVILFLTMVALLEDQLTFIGSQFNSFAESWGTLKDSLTEITEEHDVADIDTATPLPITKGSLTLENVSFEYGAGPVFANLNLHIPEGQKVGVIGRSGAGKSTLMKLLLRHYDLSAGKILIDGQDITSVTKESLRAAVAVVPQEPALFHRSISENIAYGKADATREEVVHAALQAQAHEFIETLPQGYDTTVGERGVKLSGGQRQRVAIARALLKDARILLLDEATSALDSESEVLVQKALLALMEGRTVIAIAHRLSTLRAMDRLIIFDKGEIVEDGTHDELIAKGGLYADLWNHQAGGFLED
ncbi:ABC transporter ATP-binding protein/permease [Patescibacteria group bacterium]|nr:ABC transporter ATP-binding protein/permease [Patescibacteria group bacterium]